MQLKEISRDGHGEKKESSRGLIQTKQKMKHFGKYIFPLSEILHFVLMSFLCICSVSTDGKEISCAPLNEWKRCLLL